MKLLVSPFAVKEKWLHIGRLLLCQLAMVFSMVYTHAQPISNLKITSQSSVNAFPLVKNNAAAAILTDDADAEVVTIAARAVATDIELVTNKKPAVVNSLPTNAAYIVIAGTIGQSKYIDALIQSKKLNPAAIKGKWEAFSMATIKSPMPGVQQALVIAGSDRRGTAYGLFELSRMAGVSPWVWWADVLPEKKSALFVQSGNFSSQEPSVKYRGIFINDEDWGIHPWAAKNNDTDIKDIGPNTYTKVFELMLRLRANLLWPGMHECTKAFYYYKNNPVIADQYAIVVGGSHCEPMLRNSVFEWKENYEHEYNVKPGEWRYDTNKDQIYNYWNDRVKEAKGRESVYTVGMRGIHDSGLPGPKDKQGKVSLMNTILADQRTIFSNHYNNPAAVPQIFCPYKEVLDLYNAGLQLPEDITLVWADDNHGYVRQLSTPEEQKRSGKSGVYYHISYWGVPHDYLWLSSISPALIGYEMTKSYQFGADRLWIVNVGDIKPAEMETQYFIDLAWNMKEGEPAAAYAYTQKWLSEIFGTKLGKEIAGIKNKYYQLAQAGKPEHIRMLKFTQQQQNERLAIYDSLASKVDALKPLIPQRLVAAYFQLVEYPVKAAACMNQKFFYAEQSIHLATTKDPKSLVYAQKAEQAFNQIKTLTQYYNTELVNGKWNGMMSYNPRKLPVFDMPPVATNAMMTSFEMPVVNKSKYIDSVAGAAIQLQDAYSIAAASFTKSKTLSSEKITIAEGLGLDGKSIARYPFTGASFNKENFANAPYVEYEVALKPGSYQLSLKCLPTKAIHKGRGLGMAVVVNNTAPQFADIDNSKEDKTWSAGVLRGFAEAIVPITNNQQGKTTIRVYLLDTGLALSRLDIE